MNEWIFKMKCDMEVEAGNRYDMEGSRWRRLEKRSLHLNKENYIGSPRLYWNNAIKQDCCVSENADM